MFVCTCLQACQGMCSWTRPPRLSACACCAVTPSRSRTWARTSAPRSAAEGRAASAAAVEHSASSDRGRVLHACAAAVRGKWGPALLEVAHCAMQYLAGRARGAGKMTRLRRLKELERLQRLWQLRNGGAKAHTRCCAWAPLDERLRGSWPPAEPGAYVMFLTWSRGHMSCS